MPKAQTKHTIPFHPFFTPEILHMTIIWVFQNVTHKIKLIENMRKLYLRSEYTNFRASWYPEEILSKETFINLGCQINNWNIVILACFNPSMFFLNSVKAKYIFKALCLMSTSAILSVQMLPIKCRVVFATSKNWH